MSATPHTLYTLLEGLEGDGLLPAGDAARLAALPVSEEVRDPWYVVLLVGAGAWLAGILFLVFIAGTKLVDTSFKVMIAGAVLMPVALVLRWKTKHLFNHQLAFAAGIAGQLGFVLGLGAELDFTAETWAAAFAVEVLLVWLYPDFAHRLLSTLLAVAAAAGFVYRLEWFSLIHGLVLVLAVATGLWLYEAKGAAGRLRRHYRPVGYGLAAGLLGVLILSLSREMIDVGDWWKSSIVVGGALVVLVYQVLDGQAVRGVVRWGMVVAALAVAAVAWETPGISAALFVLVLGFSRGNRLLTGAALVFLALFVGFFYYNLQLTLLVKSGVLAGSGLLFLGLRQVFLTMTRREADDG